jgi:hypothetical protein
VRPRKCQGRGHRSVRLAAPELSGRDVALRSFCSLAAPSQETAPSAPEPRDGSFEARLRALEQRVAEIEARTRPPPDPPDLAFDASFEGSPDFEGKFQAEKRDPSWADAAEKSFEEDLKKLGRRHGILSVDVECRNTMCKVVAEYASQRGAMEGLADIAHGEHRLNCGRASGPEENVGRRRHRIRGYFMCDNLRRDR